MIGFEGGDLVLSASAGEAEAFVIVVDGDFEPKHVAPYDVTTQDMFRIRVDATNIVFETAPQGGAWSTFHVTAASDFIGSSFRYSVGVHTSGPALTTAFDHLVVSAPP